VKQSETEKKESAATRCWQQTLADREADSWAVPDDSGLNLDAVYEKELIESICSAYEKDPMFLKILHTPLAYPSYQIGPDGRLWQDD
jgi:hypothetical protein